MTTKTKTKTVLFQSLPKDTREATKKVWKQILDGSLSLDSIKTQTGGVTLPHSCALQGLGFTGSNQARNQLRRLVQHQRLLLATATAPTATATAPTARLS